MDIKDFQNKFPDLLTVQIFVFGKEIEEINKFIHKIITACQNIPDKILTISEKYKNKKSGRIRINHKDVLLNFEGITKTNIENNKIEEIKNSNYVILYLNLLEHEQFDEIIEIWIPFLINEIHFKKTILICGLEEKKKNQYDENDIIDKKELIEVDKNEIDLLIDILNNSLIKYEYIEIEKGSEFISKICKPIKVKQLKQFYSNKKNCYIF